MDRPQRPVFAAIALAAAVLSLHCTDAPVTDPGVAPPDVLLSAHGGATTGFFELDFLFGGSEAGIGLDAPCLGGTFTISGPVTGWFRFRITPNGQIHATEKWDFTQLTGSMGEHTWHAAPGSGEIFSFFNPLFAGGGDPVVNVVHQGSTRFISDGEMPDVRFVHRFRVLRLPSGDFRFTPATTEVAEVKCIGRKG